MLKLQPRSLEWALNHALEYGDTDIFPVPFEFKAIKHDWENIIRWLQDVNVLEWTTRPFRRCLTPKNRFGFRISTQLDPIDYLIYTALVYEIGNDIESRRVSTERNIVHSYRFSPDRNGKFFDETKNFGTFTSTAKEHVETGEFSYVIIADISDFFAKLYSHRLENALRSATTKTNHAKALINIMSQWNEHFSYGIPIGPSASNLLSEIAIDDVDRILLSEGKKYVRYSDDFRIFCTSYRDAHETLALLAHDLFENHGLTLQQSKTKIITVEQFNDNYLRGVEHHELDTLSNRFYEIISKIGLNNPYEPIIFDDLDSSVQQEIVNLNLEEILQEQIASEELDIPITKFILRRLAQLEYNNVDIILENIDKFYPVFKDVVKYFSMLNDLSEEDKHNLGERLLNLLSSDSIVSHLEFHRQWAISLFIEDTEWNNVDRFVELYNKFEDPFSRRKIILSMGRAKQEHWFRSKKRYLFDFNSWIRRAIIAGGSCLPTDERRHWYQSLEPRLDHLEKAVVKWAKSNPF
ncbi:RNA-directed DNA polymerase [Neobacillus sp. 179-J 1A1 HS]|uniref:RNA-directed DNA polymerase n=1 Tax=Neobacillus driksii TaxID=3035913 RepID=UPI0035BC1F53